MNILQAEDPQRSAAPPEPDTRPSRPLNQADLVYLAGGPPPEKQARVTSGITDDGNPFHQKGQWLVQRNRHGEWFGYHACNYQRAFGLSESAAVVWLACK